MNLQEQVCVNAFYRKYYNIKRKNLGNMTAKDYTLTAIYMPTIRNRPEDDKNLTVTG